MTASIIIRTKNEAEALGDTLEAVLAQSHAPHEIIVIDSGSTDDTVAIAGRYPVTVLHITPDEWSYPAAINRAAEIATGEFLVCLSAHCKPATDRWLASMLDHFEHPEVAAVWGPNLREGRDNPETDEPSQRQLPGTYTVKTRSWGLSNANSALRRALWKEVPFDERLPATEDKAWGLAMLNRGLEIVYEPRAAVWHASHSVHDSYTRNRAVQAGYRLIFPELDNPQSAQLRTVGRRVTTLAKQRLQRKDLKGLLADARRLPNVVASVIGGVIGAAQQRDK